MLKDHAAGLTQERGPGARVYILLLFLLNFDLEKREGKVLIISYLTKGLEGEKERAWQAPLSLVKRQVRSIICSERADMTSRDGQSLLMLCLLAMLPRAPQSSSLTLIFSV